MHRQVGFNLKEALRKAFVGVYMSRKLDRIPAKITFKDTDGSLIVDRPCDASYWLDLGFVAGYLEQIAREKGVFVTRVDKVTKNSIECTVNYLGRVK